MFFCLRSFDSYQRRGAFVSEGASVGFIWVNHEEFSADDCGTLEAQEMFLVQLGILLVGCQHLYIFWGCNLFFVSTFLKMCHCRYVPSVTCPRKSRWNLQESGNPEPWKASDTNPEGNVFVKHGSELRLCWLARKTNLLALFELDGVLPPFCSYRFFTTLKVIQVRCSAVFVHMFICYIHIHIVRCSADVYLLHSIWLDLHFAPCVAASTLHQVSRWPLTFCSLLHVHYWMFVLNGWSNFD